MALASRQAITKEVQLEQGFIDEFAPRLNTIEDFSKALKEVETGEITTLLNVLLAATTLLDASDLHLETQQDQVKLRVRIDGMLQDVGTLQKATYQGLLSRIKLLSGIKLNIEDRPQDGRFTFVIKKSPGRSSASLRGGLEARAREKQAVVSRPVETRVSSLPSEHGESLVLRVLNPKNLRSLQDLALRKDLLALFQKEIAKPNGMVLVTGPTGSGKTTTLYAFLKEAQHPEIKIITIEDPIEYHLQGVSQTQVLSESNYTFASGLRAIVRQDPDIILVGEIRDQETADIALQAALTGHLVFSTLHTNDAAGTVSRLLSLGVKAANVSAALNLVIAQRLVRLVCKTCATRRLASPEEIAEFKRLPATIKPKLSAKIQVVEGNGCKDCNNTGYKGRIGIFEALSVTDQMELFLAKGPSIGELKAFATKNGMATMRQDGLVKIIQGLTTFEELNRVSAG